MAVDRRVSRPSAPVRENPVTFGNATARSGYRRRLLRPARYGLTVLGVLGLLLATPAGVTRLASSAASPSGLRGTVSVLEIRGPSDDKPHQVWVWRPPGPDSATIPVLYFLHGYPGTAADPFIHGIAQVLDKRLEEGYPSFVFASIDGNGERHSDTEWANSYNGNELIMDRVIDAAIPAVEGSHMRDAAHRAIAGFSMGGYGAMNIAMQNPGVFGQVVSIAGYFVVNDLSDMFGGIGSVLEKNTPSAHPCEARGMDVLLDEDTSDPNSLIRGQAVWMGGLLRSCGVPVTVHLQPGTHDWTYAMQALRYSLGFLTANWQRAAAAEGGWPPGQG